MYLVLVRRRRATRHMPLRRPPLCRLQQTNPATHPAAGDTSATGYLILLLILSGITDVRTDVQLRGALTTAATNTRSRILRRSTRNHRHDALRGMPTAGMRPALTPIAGAALALLSLTFLATHAAAQVVPAGFDTWEEYEAWDVAQREKWVRDQGTRPRDPRGTGARMFPAPFGKISSKWRPRMSPAAWSWIQAQLLHVASVVFC